MSSRWKPARHFSSISFSAAVALVAAAAHGEGVRAAVSFDVLHRFTGDPDGARPSSALIQAPDGEFCGTTIGGGAFDLGTIFTPAGTVTTLRAFTASSDGTSSLAALVLRADGNLHGTGRGAGRADGGVTFGTVVLKDMGVTFRTGVSNDPVVGTREIRRRRWRQV